MPRKARPRYHEGRKQWTARIGEPSGGRAKTVYFPKHIQDEADAWDFFARLIDQRRGREIVAADPSFGDLVDFFVGWMKDEVAAGRMEDDTVKTRKSLLNIARMHRLRGGGQVGDLKATRYDVDHHEDLLDWMHNRGYSAHYVKDMARNVSAMLSWAARPVPGREPRKILEANPVSGYKVKVAPDRPARYIPQPDMRRFLRWAWSHGRRKGTGRVVPPGVVVRRGKQVPRAGWEVERDDFDRRFDRVFVWMLQLLRVTGARPKEARTATWEDVDWEKGLIDLRKHKTSRKTGRLRTIYLTPRAVRILRALHRAPWRHPTHIFAHALAPGGQARGHDREAGEPWAKTSAIGRKLREWRGVAAGLEGPDGLPLIPAATIKGASRLVAYVNRHSYITDALLEGASAADVAKMVGNSTQVIESVYDHPVREKLAERAREIETRRRRSARKPTPPPGAP